MNKIVKETAAYSEAEIAEIRERAKRVSETEGRTVTDVAKESGVPYQTFYAFINGTYNGNNARVAGDVVIWLESREEKKQAAMAVPRDVPFVKTPSAEAILNILMFAQVMPEIVVVAGGPGIGKTSSAEQYRSRNPNVWMVTMEPCSRSTYPMLSAIAEEMDVAEKVQTRLSRAIGRKVDGRGGLLIIDEAQHLDTMAIDQLRALYDKYQVGIALLGNQSVYSKLEGESRKDGFAQLFSRIGHRITQNKPRAQDVCLLLAEWGVTDKKELQFLKAIAAKPGGLRVLTKTMKLATMLAGGADEPRGLEHIKAAWGNLSSSSDASA